MTLDYYRIFYYVARYKSFSNAAEMLGSNQPNITRCMNILENELDCKLLIRSHKGIQLTTEGEHLFRHVAIAIEQLTYGEKEIIKNKSLELLDASVKLSTETPIAKTTNTSRICWQHCFDISGLKNPSN